jgi:hypothetical protein
LIGSAQHELTNWRNGAHRIHVIGKCDGEGRIGSSKDRQKERNSGSHGEDH